MEKDERRLKEIDFALLEMKVEEIDRRVKKNCMDIQDIDDKQVVMAKRVDIFEGGVTWLYKSVFVVTALIGAFLAFIKVK